MEASVMWSALIKLAQSDVIWNAKAFIVNFDVQAEMGEDEDEAIELHPESTIYELKLEHGVASYLSLAFKVKIAQSITRDLRAYDYKQDGKSSIMVIDLKDHTDDFQSVISRIMSKDYELSQDIEELAHGKLFMVSHAIQMGDSSVRCISGRKIFPRRISRHLNSADQVVSAYFEDGELKAHRRAYFDFDEDIDFIVCEDKIFIFNKHYFEQATKYSAQMYEETDDEFGRIAQALFVEPDKLELDLVSENPQKLRRKITKILKHEEKLYEQASFLDTLAQVNKEEQLGFVFEQSEGEERKMRFPHTDEKRIDLLFTILNDNRLVSRISGKTYEASQKKEIFLPSDE
ncbi:MAG: DUF4868 domain-containing protein [Coriobacteriia bacterium]|nr:DUF4868 domain-containing protein [Coriobacteriia bacterium]